VGRRDNAPTNWTRNGGSSSDWMIASDGTQALALAQSGSPSRALIPVRERRGAPERARYRGAREDHRHRLE
jgi:hypothetical protein